MAPTKPKSYSRNIGFQGAVDIKTPMGLAIKANAKANYALSQLNAEVKMKELSTGHNITVTPTVNCLNALAQGTSNGTRVGDSVRWTQIQMRARLDGHATVDNIVRLILVRDKQPRGSFPNYTDIYDGTPTITNVMQFRNLDNIKRFDILWDKFFVIPAQNSGSSHVRVIEKVWDLQNQTRSAKKQARYGNRPNKSINETNYGLGNTGGVADISENGFFLLTVGDNTASPVDFDTHIRMRYIDN